jgi:hypothetical protein
VKKSDNMQTTKAYSPELVSSWSFAQKGLKRLRRAQKKAHRSCAAPRMLIIKQREAKEVSESAKRAAVPAPRCWISITVFKPSEPNKEVAIADESMML